MQITRLTSIPRLSWVAYIPLDGETRAFIGDWVEAGEGWILEGAWNGEFEALEIVESYSFMGSGIIEGASGTVAVAPCNTTEGIYSLPDSTGSYVSNSIPLILKASNNELDLDYLDYEADALSVAKGLHRRVKQFPLKDNKQLGVHYYCNLDFKPEPRELTKTTPPEHSNYDEYQDFLVEQTRGVAENATDPARRVHYPPIVFASNGYDSAACAVLGRTIGCDEAVVYETKHTFRSDSGAEIVASLGYSVIHEKNELDFLHTDSAELFLGTGELGTSIFFASAAEELEGKLLISGAHGDKMWDKDYIETGDRIVRSFYPDTARTEFRLATGYINYPPAFLTATIQQGVHRISNMAEMEPWTLNNDYDRPIPRRMVEESGVPREAFGMVKHGGAGSSLRFGNSAYLSRSMPVESYRRFSDFIPKVKRKFRLRRVSRSGTYLMFALGTFLSIHGHPFLSNILRLDKWPVRYTCSPFAPSLLFPWAIHELTNSFELPHSLNGDNYSTSCR